MEDATAPLRLAAAGGLVVLYYGVVVRYPSLVHGLVAQRLHRRAEYAPARRGAVELALSSVSQLMFVAVLGWLTQARWEQLVPHEIQPVRLLYGGLLGICELAVATSLCNVAIRGLIVVAPAHTPTDLAGWAVFSNAGWMRKFNATMAGLPWPLAGASILAYVGVEELVFRGVLLTLALPLGAVPAVVLVLLPFTLVQALHMPSLESAVCPMIGAIVIGTVHGALFVNVPDLTPLLVAHFVYFLAAML